MRRDDRWSSADGASAAIAAAVCVSCPAMFYIYGLLRRRVTGRETHISFEQLWLALAVCTAVAFALGAHVWVSLDLFAGAIACFLAVGRLGCLMAGCCYGWPSAWGITYSEGSGSRAVPHHLLGIRLFPAPLVESLGLFVIAIVCICSLGQAGTGRVIVFFLIAYSLLRLATERYRGDERPILLGLSEPNWCAGVQLFAAILVADRGALRSVIIAGALAAGLVGMQVARWRRSPRRGWLSGEHVEELRRAARETTFGQGTVLPLLKTTTCGLTVGVSPGQSRDRSHVSMSCAQVTLPDLCQLAATAWGRIIVETARFSANGVLQFEMRTPGPDVEAERWKMLYRHAAFWGQRHTRDARGPTYAAGPLS